jgi:hypothetical protein
MADAADWDGRVGGGKQFVTGVTEPVFTGSHQSWLKMKDEGTAFVILMTIVKLCNLGSH